MFHKIFLAIKRKQKQISHIIKNHILMPMIFAFIFSIPLYLNIMIYKNEIYSPYVNSFFVLIALFVFIKIPKTMRFSFGFFVGVAWFYWIGLSFRFTSSPNLFYLTIFFVSFIYGILFYLLLWFQNGFFRAFMISIVGYISILGFNWFVPDALLAFSIFKVDKLSFVILVFMLVILNLKQLKKMRFLNIIFFLFIIDFSENEITIPSNIHITQTNINQAHKWKDINEILDYNLSLIQESIDKNDKIIILPETAFPFSLNKQEQIIKKLLSLSQNITIITGAQRKDKNKIFNSTYVFEKGTYSFADKIFLAPFGEYMPIPSTFINITKKIFGIDYDSSFDFNLQNPRDLKANDIVFRNAICYEATTRQAYQNNPKYMIAISNNAWFSPSLEPVLQMTLMKYYARLHHTTIFHSANGSKSFTITPQISFDFLAKLSQKRL